MYPEIIRRHLPPRLDFAVMQKIYATEQRDTKEVKRRYSPPACTGVRVEIVAGVPHEDRICTSFVERTNLSVRHFNKRFARLGLGWSRKLGNHLHATSLCGGVQLLQGSQYLGYYASPRSRNHSPPLDNRETH